MIYSMSFSWYNMVSRHVAAKAEPVLKFVLKKMCYVALLFELLNPWLVLMVRGILSGKVLS